MSKEKKDNKNVSDQKVDNSAIGSWSGYIYQGLCGVLVVVKLLNQDKDKYKGYFLQLDGYEDFSIMDDKNLIVSMHQCKSVKNQTDYSDEFTKMQTKVNKLRDSNKTTVDVSCWFHCNRNVDIPEGFEIKAYEFKKDVKKCGPGEIRNLIEEEIKYCSGDESNSTVKYARLDSLVNNRVLAIQQEYFNSHRPLKEIAREHKESIPFIQFIDILDAIDFTLHRKDLLNTIRNDYVTGLQQKMSEEIEHDVSDVETFIEKLCLLDQEHLREFLQRINPKDKLEETFRSYRTITDESRIKLLYRLLLDIPVINDNLDWLTINSAQTPTTLGNEESILDISRHIYQNRANLDAAWIYDWFVGRVDEHVDNIRKKVSEIMDVENDDESKIIFKTKKVGILTINEKKNGEFD